jgi:hypothetical protein
MSYRLVKNQLGGGSFEILMLIVAVAVVYYLFVQSQRPVKEKYEISESYSQSIPSSSPESTYSDELNRKNRPAVDLKAAGVPYLDPPASYSDNESVVSSPTASPTSSVASSPKAVSGKVVSTAKKIEKYTNVTDVNKLYSVRDSYDLKTPLSKSQCSQKCCGHYWKEGIMGNFKGNDPVKWSDVGVGKKYRPSNVTCMGDGVAQPGCRCYTSNQFELLGTRGGNSSKQF